MWADPRTPVSVTRVGKFTVTIFDQAAYDQSLIDYPDDGRVGKSDKDAPTPIKQKPAARWNWVTKLDRPLAG